MSNLPLHVNFMKITNNPISGFCFKVSRPNYQHAVIQVRDCGQLVLTTASRCGLCVCVYETLTGPYLRCGWGWSLGGPGGSVSSWCRCLGSEWGGIQLALGAGQISQQSETVNGSIKLEQSTEVMTVHSVKPLLNVMMTHKIVVRVFE